MVNNISVPIPTANSMWFRPIGTAPSSPRSSGKDLFLSSSCVGDGAELEGVVEMELPSEGEQGVLRGTKAERRFMALNPHGTLDYCLPNGTGLISNDYVDMITAHSSYWSAESFAAFIMAEIFATSADYLRSGALCISRLECLLSRPVVHLLRNPDFPDCVSVPRIGNFASFAQQIFDSGNISP